MFVIGIICIILGITSSVIAIIKEHGYFNGFTFGVISGILFFIGIILMFPSEFIWTK